MGVVLLTIIVFYPFEAVALFEGAEHCGFPRQADLTEGFPDRAKEAAAQARM